MGPVWWSLANKKNKKVDSGGERSVYRRDKMVCAASVKPSDSWIQTGLPGLYFMSHRLHESNAPPSLPTQQTFAASSWTPGWGRAALRPCASIRPGVQRRRGVNIFVPTNECNIIWTPWRKDPDWNKCFDTPSSSAALQNNCKHFRRGRTTQPVHFEQTQSVGLFDYKSCAACNL